MSRDYLHQCRELFEPLTTIRYGRAQGLDRIQDEAARIQSSRRLTYDDIARIRDSEAWNADIFGYWPSRDEIESVIESTQWDFWNLPKRETKAITGLFRVFRQIEPVSVILRFVVPRHYGIMSPPVRKVLGLGSFRRHAEEYLAYLTNLRDLRDDRGFDTAADVDMALWVLQVGVLDNLLARSFGSRCRNLKREFHRDSKLREIRVANLTRQLFSDLSRAELAEALLATNVELAAQVAGIEFERSVKRLTRAKPDDTLSDLVRDELPPLLRELGQREGRTTTTIIECKEAVRTRNDAVHSEGAPSIGRINRLIEAMKAVGEMERARCPRPKTGADVPAAEGTDASAKGTLTAFWREPTIDELAAEQGIGSPLPFEAVVGAATDLWDDDDDFDLFVQGIQDRRLEQAESGGDER